MTTSLLVTLIALCAPPCIPNEPLTLSVAEHEPWLDVPLLVGESDQIVRAEIVALRDVNGAQPRSEAHSGRNQDSNEPVGRASAARLIELRIDEVLWGDSTTQTMTIYDDPRSPRSRTLGGLHIGERAYWFVERSRCMFAEDAATQAWMREEAGAGGLQEPVLQGLGRFVIDGDPHDRTVSLPAAEFRISASLPLIDTDEASASKRAWLRVRGEDLDRCVRAALREFVPSICVNVVSNGPMTPYVKIAPDGGVRATSYDWEGEVRMTLDPAQWRSLLEFAQQQHFFELPTDVGHSLGPCSTIGFMRIRTERGARSIRIHGPTNLKSDSAADRLATEKAYAIWDKIPIVGDRQIDGH